MIGGEGAGVGVEGAGAVEGGELSVVSEGLRGPLVEHLFESDQAELGMLRGAGADVGWESSQKLDEFSPGMSEARQVSLRRACGEAFGGGFVLF